MKIANIAVPNWVFVVGAAGVALYIIKKGSVQDAVAGVAAGAVDTAADVVTGVTQGVVNGVGGLVGIPSTSVSMCRQSINAADNVGASKYCSAGVFMRWQYLSTRKKLTGQTFTMSDIFN